MLKKILNFVKEYTHFSIVVIVMLVSLGLALGDYDKAANILLSVTALLSALPIIWDIYQSLRHGEYGVDILAATAIITSVVLGEVWAGMVIVLMLTGGEALEDGRCRTPAL